MAKLSSLLLCASAALLCSPWGLAQAASVELVQTFLWPRDAAQFDAAQASLAASEDSLSRLEMLALEEWMRAGPGGLTSIPPATAGTFPVQEFEVRAGTELSTPVYVQLPRGYTPERQWPLMLAMHGGPTGTAQAARGGARRMLAVWAKAADAAGWIVAAPAMQSTCSQGTYSPERLPYEVFHPEQAAALLAGVRARFAVNPDRVVSTGISLGSNFSIAFACARPDWLAAIVPVSTEGDSRELLLRNMSGVPIYLLEGTRDQNIRGISGPRALQEILVGLGYDIQYREFSDRSHEGFGEHYGDVLRWLDSRPRHRDPKRVLRVPHGAIMPVARRVHWIECDTRQGLVRAEVRAPGRIVIEVQHARKLKLFLNDHLVDLDRELQVVVNGVLVYKGLLKRSLRVALEQARELGDERRFYCAELSVSVPTSEPAMAVARALAQELAPSREAGTLSFWEMYAQRAALERFPSVGFEAALEELPAALDPAQEREGLRVSSVDPQGPLAGCGLQAGDLLLEFGAEPFYRTAGGLDGLHAWLVRELRQQPAPFELLVLRAGQTIALSANLGLGAYKDADDPLSNDKDD